MKSHQHTINFSSTLERGAGVHIGIVDTLSDGPGVEHFDVREGKSFVDSEERETYHHGMKVFEHASWFAEESAYSFYQAIPDDGSLNLIPLASAIDAAIGDEVDVLNISAGVEMEGCEGYCGFCEAASRALDAGVTVVCAAGNNDPDHDRDSRIHCPATRDGTISVGGLIPECRCLDYNADADIEDPPPGAFYPEFERNPATSRLAHDPPICGQSGECAEGFDCTRNLVESPWLGNPLPFSDQPTVLAPCFGYFDHSHHPHFDFGTSFAAPIVSAAIACVLSEVQQETGQLPSNDVVYQQVTESAAEIMQSDLQKLNTTRLLNYLVEELGQSS